MTRNATLAIIAVSFLNAAAIGAALWHAEASAALRHEEYQHHTVQNYAIQGGMMQQLLQCRQGISL